MAEWWEKWRGGIKAGGRRGEVGGRMNRRKKGSWVLCGAKGEGCAMLPRCLPVFFLYECICDSACFFF